MRYRAATVTIYSAGEPRELTNARDDLGQWYLTAVKLNRDGTTALVPYLVGQALHFGGWVK